MGEALFVLVSMQFMTSYISTGLIIGKTNKSFFRIAMVLFLSVIGALSYQFTGVYGALFILCFNFLLYYIDIKKLIPVLGGLGIAMISNLLFDHVASVLDSLFEIPSRFPPIIYILIHQGVVIVSSIITCILVRKLLLRFLPQGLKSKEGHVISLLSFFTYIVYLVCIFLGVGLGNTIELIQLNLLFLLFI